MIKRETIMAHRRVVNKMDYNPTAETIRMLCDGAIELMNALEGGPGVQAQRAELKERERQLVLALDDLYVWADDAGGIARSAGAPAAHATGKVGYAVNVIRQMLKAKGPQWNKTWAQWKPQVEEEFDDVDTSERLKRYWVYLGNEATAGPFSTYVDAHRERTYLLTGLVPGCSPAIFTIRTDEFGNAPPIEQTKATTDEGVSK